MKRQLNRGQESLNRKRRMSDSLNKKVRIPLSIMCRSGLISLVSTVTTGEEEEKTYFSSKAKLFRFSDKEWRERGIGTFKVNLNQSENKDENLPPRLIMRADGVLRVMLNTPIFKGMTVGDASGNEPKSKQIHLASLESGRSVPILLRVSLPVFKTLRLNPDDNILTDQSRCQPKTSQKSYITSSVAFWITCKCRSVFISCWKSRN